MLQLFKLLLPGDIGTQLTKLNTMIRESMTDYAFRKKQLVKPITQHEFLKFCAILMIARYEGVASGNLWKNGGRSEGYRDIPNIANKYMPKHRLDEIKWYCSYLWSDASKKEQDDWWMLTISIKNFLNQEKSTLDHATSR